MKANYSHLAAVCTHNFFKFLVLFFALFFGVSVNAQDYNPSFCGGTDFESVITNVTANPSAGQCVFYSNVQVGIQVGGNSKLCINGSCKDSYQGWYNQSELPAKVDGGYYVYLEKGSTQSFGTKTAGEPQYTPATPTITNISTNEINLLSCDGTIVPQTFSIKGKAIDATEGISIAATGGVSVSATNVSKTDAESAAGAVVTVSSDGTEGTITCTAGTSEVEIEVNVILTSSSMNVNKSAINTGLDYSYGTAAGSIPQQSFMVEAICLSNSIGISAAPAGFVTSTNGTDFSAAAKTLPAAGGQVWLRLAEGLTASETPYAGAITVTGSSGSPQTVAVQGSVTYPVRDLYLQAGSNQDWGTLSNWRTGCGGGSAAASLPTQYDNVIICGGNDGERLFVVAQETTAECKTLTFSDNNTNNVKHLRIDGSLTVYGNVDATKSSNNPDNITVSTGGTLEVRGNVAMGSQNGDATFTANGTATILGDFTVNTNKRGKVAGNGLLQVGGNLQFGNNNGTWNTPDLTLEMTGCGQTVTIEKNMTVGTFVQSATCTATYTKAGNSTITTTVYNQNCNEVNLRPASGFSGGTTVDENLLNSDCNTPKITVAGSISAMSACVNTFGAAQSFTVSAKNLIDELVIGPLEGYQFSKTNTDESWYSSLTYDAPTVAETDVYVRLNQSASAGSFPAAAIPVTSSGAPARQVATGTGTINEAFITSPLQVVFNPVCVDDDFGRKAFTVQGECLTGSITFTAHSGYTVYDLPADGTPISSVSAHTLNTGATYYLVRSAQATFSNQNAVDIISGTDTLATITASGEATLNLTGSTAAPLAFGSVCSGESFDNLLPFTVRGNCIAGSGVNVAAEAGFEIYENPEGTPTSGFPAVNVTLTRTNAKAGRIYYLKRTALTTFNGTAVTLSTGSGENTVTHSIQATGTVKSHDFTGSTTGTLDFAPICPGESFNNVQPFTVQGGCIASSGVRVAVADGFELYNNSLGTATAGFPATNVTVSQANAEAGQIYWLKRSAAQEFTSFSGTAVTLSTGTGANEVTQIIRAAGVVNTPSIGAETTSEVLSYPLGEGPDEHSFMVSAQCLSNSIHLYLEGDDADKFEITTTGSFDHISTALPKEGGRVYVRFKEGYEDPDYTAVIRASTGQQEVTVDLAGTVVVTPRNFYYSGTGNWNNAGNWYKSCGNTSAGNQWNAVPNKYDNVTLCAGADVSVTSDIIRKGNFTFADDNANPVKLEISGALHLPNGFAANAGQITITPAGLLNVTGDFTFQRNDKWKWSSQQPIFIDNQGTVTVTDGKFEMSGRGDSDRLNMAAYFNNAGAFHLTNSDFIINTGRGAFFYNETGALVNVDNSTAESTKTVKIEAQLGRDENCTRQFTYYCNGITGGHSTPTGKDCNLSEETMQGHIALGYTQVEEGENAQVFLNTGSLFNVIGSALPGVETNMNIFAEGSSRTHTVKGKIYVKDGNFNLNSGTKGSGLRFRLKTGAGIYVHNTAEGNDKGMMSIDGKGGGAQVWVEDRAEVFSRGFSGGNQGGCNAMNLEPGALGFIGDMAATVTDQFKIHVLDNADLFYCGNKAHPVGDEVGHVYASGRLHYANDKYEGIGEAEANPITNIGGKQDFYLKDGAEEGQVLKIRWESIAACQADFDRVVEGKTGEGVLPIELIEFTGKVEPSAIILHWTTMTETNNDYFIVQRLGSNNNFYNIGSVDGAGTTAEPRYYSFYDYNPLTGISYYRLMQTDFNGVSSYSPVLPMVFNTTDPHFEVFTHTQQGITHFNLRFSQIEEANSIAIHTLGGMQVYSGTVPAGVSAYSIKLTLSPGIYVVSNVYKGIKQTVKVQVH